MPRGPAVLAAVSVLLLAGCVQSGSLVPGPAAGRLAPQAWKALLTEPRFDGVDRTVHEIASEDGTRLTLTLHLPRGLGEDEEVPTLLQITPYQAGRSSDPVRGVTPSGNWWEFAVERGAAYVEADARGTNGSEGCLDFGGGLDRMDARAFVAWIRAQSWSDGRVVVDGISHPGMGSVVAHVAVPGLTAALAHAPVVSYYRDEWYQGARFEDQANGAAYQAIEALPAFYGDGGALLAQAAPCTGETVVDFNQPDGRFTEAWADRDLSRVAGEARAPILLTHGFVDQNVHPDHFQLYWDALPGDFPKHAVLGWWYHTWPTLRGHPARSEDDNRHPFFDLRHRWLDATLFDMDNGLFNEPQVLVEDNRGTWHEGKDWPLESSETFMLHATADGELGPEPGPATGFAYVDRQGAARGSWTDAHVAFRTEPLAQARLVNGAPVVDLVASSSVETTKWVVYLLDEAPDGTWSRVSHGYVDSHTWNGPGEWAPMEPGKAYAWRVALMPTAVVVEAGHRLVLLVASHDSRGPPFGFSAEATGDACWHDYRDGCYAPSGILPAETRGRGENTILAGEGGTSVTLSWVDPALTAKPPWVGEGNANQNP